MHVGNYLIALILSGAVFGVTSVHAQSALTGMFGLTYTTIEMVGPQTTQADHKAKTEIRKDYERYKRDGVEHSKLIFEMESLGTTPSPDHMDEAIRYLDSHLAR
jgi:hypothetical protein